MKFNKGGRDTGRGVGYDQSWNFQLFPEVQNCPSLLKELEVQLEVQLLQVEVQLSGAPMIQHINLIWGTKT